MERMRKRLSVRARNSKRNREGKKRRREGERERKGGGEKATKRRRGDVREANVNRQNFQEFLLLPRIIVCECACVDNY